MGFVHGPPARQCCGDEAEFFFLLLEPEPFFSARAGARQLVRLRLLVLINSQLLLKYTKKIHSLSRKVGTFIHSFNLEVNEYSFRLCTMGLWQSEP